MFVNKSFAVQKKFGREGQRKNLQKNQNGRFINEDQTNFTRGGQIKSFE
jgi:hypothetical protein